MREQEQSHIMLTRTGRYKTYENFTSVKGN